MVVAMPASRAIESPAASGRLLITCVIAPSMPPSRACAISAPRFEPRREIRTVMRESAIEKDPREALAESSNDNGARGARRALDHRADDLRAFAGGFEQRDRALGIVRRNHCDHSDSAIEYAMHLRAANAAFALQPVENRRPRPALPLDARLQRLGQNSRNVFD